MKRSFRIAVVCGKLGDVDGVSLEVDKWVKVLSLQGHTIYTIAGYYAADLSLVPKERRMTLPAIGFDTPFQKEIEALMFPHINPETRKISSRNSRNALLEKLDIQAAEAAERIHHFILAQEIDVLIAQNTNAMPMTLVAASAVYKLATEYKMAIIFHHHDFWWERSRFSGGHMEGFLNTIMPPMDPSLEHVVISSYAAHNLRTIKRIEPVIVPNCEDFGNPPIRDDYTGSFRRDMGYKEDDLLFVQPTRIVPRKRIEDSLRLVGGFIRRYPNLKERIKFIISLYQGDERDDSYVERIGALAASQEVSLDLIAERVASVRGKDSQGRRLYTNRDVLVNADFVTYLPLWEGFGNALLEAVAARVPVAVSTYMVYKTDIMNRGFEGVEIWDDYDSRGNLRIPERALERIHEILFDSDLRKRITENSFHAMEEAFGMPLLQKKLKRIMEGYGDEILASRRRLEKRRAVFAV